MWKSGTICWVYLLIWLIELRLDVGKFFFLWFFGWCGSALGESSYWEGLKRRLLFVVFGVLGTGIQVNLSVCVFSQSRVDFRYDQQFFYLFFLFFSPFIQGSPCPSRNGHEWNGQMIHHQQKQHPLQLTTFPTTWEVRILTPGELEEQKLLEDKSKDLPGKNDPMTPRGRPEVGLEPCDPPKKNQKAERMPAVARSFSIFLILLLLHFFKISIMIHKRSPDKYRLLICTLQHVSHFFCCCWKPFLKPLPETNPFSHLKVGGWNTIVSSWDGGLFSGANLLWVLGSVTSSADWIWWSISWTNPSLRSVRNWMNSSSQDSMIEFLSVQFLSLQVHHTWILDLNNMIVLNRWICPRSFSYPIKYKFWLKLHFLSTNFAHLQPTSIWNILYIKIPSSFCSVSVAPPGPAPEKLKMSFQLKAEKVALYVGDPLAGKWPKQLMNRKRGNKQFAKKLPENSQRRRGNQQLSVECSLFCCFCCARFLNSDNAKIQKGPQEVLEPFFCRNLLAAWKLWAPFPRGFLRDCPDTISFSQNKKCTACGVGEGWMLPKCGRWRRRTSKKPDMSFYFHLYMCFCVIRILEHLWSSAKCMSKFLTRYQFRHAPPSCYIWLHECRPIAKAETIPADRRLCFRDGFWEGW